MTPYNVIYNNNKINAICESTMAWDKDDIQPTKNNVEDCKATMEDHSVSERLKNVLKDIKKAVTIEDTPETDEGYLYDEANPLLCRFLGALPLQKSNDGVITFKVLSPAMLYSACVYLTSLAPIILIGKQQMAYMTASESFDDVIYAQLIILYFVNHLFIPVTFWLDAPKIAKYYNDWINFQNSFKEITSQRLRLNIKRMNAIWFWILVYSPIPSQVALFYSMPSATVAQIPSFYFFASLTLIAIISLWYCNCVALGVAGRSIAKSFQVSMKTELCSAKAIGEYKNLWLKLSKLSDQWGYSVYRVYGTTFLVVLYIFTSSIYGMLATLGTKEYRFVGFLFNSIVTIIPFYLCCDVGHWVPGYIRDGIEEELHKLSPTDLTPHAWEEVKAFLHVISSNASSINLAGYLDINHALTQAAGATVVTYLIVLLQFDKEHKSNSDFNNTNAGILESILH